MVSYRPYVILSAAMTLDGKIASMNNDSKLSSKQDKIRLHKLRARVDGILVGKNTIQRDDPILTVRYAKGKNPTRIILDSRGTISTNSRVMKTCRDIPTIIAVSKKISKKKLINLKKFPLSVIVAGTKEVNLKKLLRELKNKKINTIIVEGGGTVNWNFIKENLIDEVIITITPYFIGGRSAISLVGGEGFSKISKSRKLKLKKVVRIDNELVLNYTT